VVYEWDAAKAKANLRKHGVSFDDAATVYLDPLALTFPDPFHSSGEQREITIGYTAGHQVVFVAHCRSRKPRANHQRTKGDWKRAETI
jgi:uncharacterized protein